MAGEIEITWDGLDQLRMRLQRMAGEYAATTGRTLPDAMRRSLYMLVFTLAKYPRQRRPASGRAPYRRTGTLGRRWTEDIQVTRQPWGLKGSAGNNTEYGPLVQSARFQQPWHKRTGWETDKTALTKNMPKIIREFERANAEIVNRE